MFFKLILIGSLGYFLMRMVFKPKELTENRREKIQKTKRPAADGEYVDYEEIE